MKKLNNVVFATLLGVSLSSFANNNHFCKVKKDKTNHYKHGDNYYIYKDFSIYRFEGEITRLFPSKHHVRGLEESNGYLFHLIEDHIVRRDLRTSVREAAFRTTQAFPKSQDEKSQDLTIMNEMAYVAHGTIGISKLDPFKGVLLKETALTSFGKQFRNSKATGIANHNGRILVSLEITKSGGFQGIIELDEDLRLLKKMEYPRRFFMNPKIKVDNEKVYFVSGSDIHIFNYNDLVDGEDLKPIKVLKKVKGEHLVSNPEIVDGVFYGCLRKVQNRKFVYKHREVEI